MDIAYKEFPEKSQLYGYIQEQLKRIGEETTDVTAVLATTLPVILKLHLKLSCRSRLKARFGVL